ncbi:MAG: hypothetical protein NC405_05835 [Odoribacter sp.]|nr:hypothetical protein [Odoribacter sp.]
MIKKIFLLLALITGVHAATAQHAPGSWRVFPMSGEFFDQVIDTSSKVYYITGGSLYSYDKEFDETVYYTPGSRISQSGIQKLYYNDINNYLMVVYNNSNIDLIYSDGRVVNMPEIKDANITADKTINDVSFNNNSIYIATGFGLVVYDDQNHVVKESAILGKSIPHVVANDDFVFINVDYAFFSSPIEERHNSLDKFTKLAGVVMEQLIPIDSNNILFVNGTGANATIYKLVVNAPVSAYFSRVVAVPNLVSFYKYRDGFIAQCDNGLVLFDTAGNVTSTVALNEVFDNQILATYSGLNSMWGADNDGIARYKIENNAYTTLSEKFRPASSQQFGAGYCQSSPDGSGVYVTRIGMSEYHHAGDAGWSQHLPFICERYDWTDGTFTPVYPYGVRNTSSESQLEADLRNSKYFYGGPGNTLIDPVDHDLIYHANNFEGLIIIKDREVLHEITSSVIPNRNSWNSRVECIEFDQMGNLWIGVWAYKDSPFAVLPKAAVDKLRRDPSSIVRSDFIKPSWPADDEGKCDMRLVAIPGTNKLFHIRGSYGGPMIGYDTKGTSSFTDDSFVSYTSFVDQDGTQSTPTFKTCVTVDKNNHVWVGTSAGVFVIRDIDQLGVDAGTDRLNVIRPKVSRNDGTNYADYLLSSELIYYIAVDPSNRKWIATQASGVYLVNEDGTEILEHFNTDNSPLLSNEVYTVACDSNSNDVLLGTPDGMFLYSSTSAPASDDYSEVYAFPNPVRPEYTGWITINGLMDNSLVKIADMQGNVFWEGTSEGGMVVWDGCNRDGSRVRSGVYMVYASQNSSGESSGAVTKIVVIN